MSTKTIVIGFILFSVIFVGGTYFLFAKGNKPEIKIISYSSQDNKKPVVKIGKTLIDLGKIKVSDQKEATFTIKNIGTQPLQVYNMSSSCHCTFGQLVYQGKTSDEYGMSNVSDILASIAPNTEALVKVIYRPYIMPVYGPIEREVYLSTNDPSNQKLVFQITATVH